MKRATAEGGMKSLFALIVVALATSIFLISILAARENLRYARANEQILSAVSMAREMRFSPSTNAEQAVLVLLERLSHLEGIAIKKVEEKKTPFIENPWGKETEIEIFPLQQKLHIRALIPFYICRKMILFYGKNLVPLGIDKIETENRNIFSANRRLIYEITKTGLHNGSLSSTAIKTGCGEEKEVNLLLTFKLGKDPA